MPAGRTYRNPITVGALRRAKARRERGIVRLQRQVRARQARRRQAIYKPTATSYFNKGGNWPDQKYVNMVYTERFTLPSSAGAVNTQQIQLNNINDPDFTGGGHQPMTHDQLAVLYNRFTVIRCKLEMYFTAESFAQRVCIRPNTTSSLVNFNTEVESPYSRFFVVPLNEVVRRSYTYDISQIFGLPKGKVIDDDAYSAVFSSGSGGPAQTAYLNISNSALDGITTSDLHYQVKMTFTVRCFDRLNLAQS